MNQQDRGKRSKQTFNEIPSLKSEQSKADASRLRDTWRAVPNRGGASGLLGKDEGPSSNLGSSYKKDSLKRACFWVFCLVCVVGIIPYGKQRIVFAN